MSQLDDNVPELKRQDHVCVDLRPVLETVSDVEREEEFAMFLDKLIWKEQVRNGRRVTENKNVENKK